LTALFSLPKAIIEELGARYEIKDLESLRLAAGEAMYAYAENSDAVPDFREKDTLDELAMTLRRAAELIGDPLNGNRLALYWRTQPLATQSGLPYIPDWIRQAEFMAQTANEAHQLRVQARGRLPRRDVRAATKVLVDYWITILGRRFTQDQMWAEHCGQRVPVTTSEYFVYDVLRSFLGNKLAGELRSIAREFASNRR
jgi:hypothetical protein